MQMIQRFFLKDSKSIAQLFEIFNTFAVFSGLKSNLTTCEIAEIGAQLSACGMKCINLRNEAIKILWTYLSYNNTTKEESHFRRVASNV